MVEGGLREMSFETERLALLVLQIVNRTQAKGSTVRLVYPRDREMLEELGRTLGTGPAAEELLPVEDYLLEHGYVARVDIGLSTGSYSITTAGLEWLERNILEAPVMPQGLSDEAQSRGEDENRAPELVEEAGSVVVRGERDRLLEELEEQRLRIERLEAELREARRPWWKRTVSAYIEPSDR
jgi:DNA-binding PadR family transcriptional regulator